MSALVIRWVLSLDHMDIIVHTAMGIHVYARIDREVFVYRKYRFGVFVVSE